MLKAFSDSFLLFGEVRRSTTLLYRKESNKGFWKKQSCLRSQSESAWFSFMRTFPFMEFSNPFNRCGMHDRQICLCVGIAILGLYNSKINFLQIQFVIFHRRRRELQWMAAFMLQAIPGFYAKISEESLFISANTQEKDIVCRDYCIAHHDDKTCSLPVCKWHFLLFGEMRSCYINWIHFVSSINTSTVCIPCSNNDSAKKILHRVQLCLKMYKVRSHLNMETEKWTKCRVLQKRDSREKSWNIFFWVPSERTNQRRPVV